jgi:3-dehydroquinate synthetase
MKSKIEYLSSNEIHKKILYLLNHDNSLLVVEDKIQSQLKFNHPRIIVMKGGEQEKNYQALEKVIHTILSIGVVRTTTLVVVGGGALSDLVGLAAALILRGISWISVPTTLLSQVDAGIGGKVAINSSLGKNLIGAFHQPKEIWISSDFLLTLPQKEVLNGRGEILKYAFLDKSIAELVLKKRDQIEIIKACIEFKMTIVEKDPKEKDLRRILNLGHTFGHAYESFLGLTHGEAVALGLKKIIEQFSPKLKNDFEKLCKALEIQLPECPPTNENIQKFILQDKKRTDILSIEIIIPVKVGEVERRKVLLDTLWK